MEVQSICWQREDGIETGIKPRTADTGQSQKLIPEAPVLVSGPSLCLFMYTFRKSLFPSELRSCKSSSPLLPSLRSLFQGLLRHLCFPFMVVLFS